jgi:hypothetical protein
MWRPSSLNKLFFVRSFWLSRCISTINAPAKTWICLTFSLFFRTASGIQNTSILCQVLNPIWNRTTWDQIAQMGLCTGQLWSEPSRNYELLSSLLTHLEWLWSTTSLLQREQYSTVSLFQVNFYQHCGFGESETRKCIDCPFVCDLLNNTLVSTTI